MKAPVLSSGLVAKGYTAGPVANLLSLVLSVGVWAMWSFFQHLLDTDGFVPRWICGQWSGGLGWTYVVADVAIFAAYAAIPALLVFFVRRRQDVPFHPIFWLFALFILSCGLTHLIDASLFWYPWYRLSALVKIVTAVASWFTVLALFRVVPAALLLPGLARVNERLVEEMARREAAQKALLVSEERLRLATDAAEVGIWQWEIETDEVTWENEWLYKIIGMATENGPVNAAAFARDFVHSEDRALFEQSIQQATRNKSQFYFRGRMVRSDGEIRWVEFMGRSLLREAGSPPALIGTARDITERVTDELALRKAHDHLENVLGSITDGLAVVDKDWRYTYCNRQGAELLGVRVEDLLGARAWDVFPRAKGTLFYEGAHRAMATGRPEHFQDYYPEPLNKWLECHCYPAKEGLSVYFQDVTARVQAENVLQQNAALFSKLVQNAPWGIYVVDAQFRMQQVNPIALPVFENVRPLIGRDFSEVMETLWGPEVGSEVAAVFRKTLETGEPYQSPPFDHLRIDIAVQQVFEWETQRVQLPSEEQMVICYFRDVTEQRRIEEAIVAGRETLRKRTEELETLLDAMPVFVWITTQADCKVITGNRAANELTGTPPGMNVSQSAVAEGQAVYLKQLKEDGTEYLPDELPLQRAVATGQPVKDKLVDFRFANGRRVIALGNAVPLFDETSQVRGGLGAFLDITALKQAETDLIEARRAAEIANVSKDRFLAMISHELRTPLNPALMAINLMDANRKFDQETREDIVMIKRNLELEVKLIEDLLDISRISTGKMMLDIGPVQLPEVVREVCAICHEQIVAKNIGLETSLSPEVVQVAADPTRLRQVLWNLLRNAIKFTPVGGHIRITTKLFTEDRYEVAVRDTGIGIAPEKLSEIFAAFEQGDVGITQQFGGLGLGLAISRALVDLHGGTIHAESAGPGQGATFILKMPIGEALKQRDS